MKKKSVVVNYLYNLTYQLFVILVPIIVTPYISRILTDVGSGQYSFSYSISNYFTLIASLGFGYYGQRQIAKHQNDPKKQTTDFWGIIITRFISVILSLVIYLLMSSFGAFGDKYVMLLQILSINVIAVGFDIAFFFNANEEFKKTVLRNVIVKVLSVICIFVFVKDIDDLWIYTLIQALSVLLGNISLWLYLPKYLVKVSMSEINIKKHIKPALILFLPAIATSIYTTLDKTLIGVITQDDSQNGNYEYADRLIKMVLTVITALGAVLIPRNAKRFEDGDIEGVKKNIYLSCRFVFLVGAPAMFGMMAIAYNFVPWFLGDGYDLVPLLLILLAPLFLIIGLSNVFGLQYLIPSAQDKKFTLCLIIGAVSNLLLNLVMIYFWGAYGAAGATVVAESLVTFSMLMLIRKDIKFTNILKYCWKYIVSSIVMAVPCFLLAYYLPSSILNTFLIVITGAIIYGIMILILRDKFVFDLLNKVLLKIKKKNK